MDLKSPLSWGRGLKPRKARAVVGAAHRIARQMEWTPPTPDVGRREG